MNSLTRRSFMQLCGVTLAAAALPARPPAAALPQTLFGRALRAAAITDRPDPTARMTGRLWPDAITALHEVSGEFYAVPHGFVPVEAVQPMPGWEPGASGGVTVPGWAEVSAPVAPLRAWASAEAPLTARIGFGGVLAVLDRLDGPDGTAWLAVGPAPDSAPLGWTPADRWRNAALPEQPPADETRTLRLDRTAAAIVALEGGREILRAAVAVPPDVRPAAIHLPRRGPALPGVPAGAAWVLSGPDALIYGAHWHNCFGGVGAGPGWEVLPWTARWLHTWLPEGAPVRVV